MPPLQPVEQAAQLTTLNRDSLAEITQLLQQKTPELKQTIESTGSLRRMYPSVKVAESIYSQEDRMSVYSAADSMLASSDLDFDFDDIIVNSAAYRRALAAARHQAPAPALPPVVIGEDLIDFSDTDTIQQDRARKVSIDAAALDEDLLGLRFSTIVDETGPKSSIVNDVQGHEATGGSDKDSFTSAAESPILVQTIGVQTISTADSNESTLSLATESAASHLLDRSADPQQGRSVSAGEVLAQPPESPVPNQSHTPPDLSPLGNTRVQPALRTCFGCSKPLNGKYVRALGHVYHLECFNCKDCGKIVASNFFPVPDKPPNQYALCETNYFKRLDLLCFGCGESLRGSYISALGRKYHREHFTCHACPTVFGEKGEYYERHGQAYCFNDYATMFASPCNGCGLPILKQFVEIARNGMDQIWHPECYMIHKYWNIRMSDAVTAKKTGSLWTDKKGLQLDAVNLSLRCDSASALIHRTWTVLSAFEEKTATSISDVLISCKDGQQPTAVRKMACFLAQAGSLFTALESVRERKLRSTGDPGKAFSKEAKLLCKKCLGMMAVIASSPPELVQGVTPELLTLVTRIARHLKMLIRIKMQDAMGQMDLLLDDISSGDVSRDLLFYRTRLTSMVTPENDLCTACKRPVEDACLRRGGAPVQLWHDECFECPRCHRTRAFATKQGPIAAAACQFCGSESELDIYRITQLQQFTNLLWVGLARLNAALKLDPSILIDVHMEQSVNTSEHDIHSLPEVDLEHERNHLGRLLPGVNDIPHPLYI